MVVQYEYAKDENGRLINIKEVIENNKIYVCATEGCNTEMIPVFGKTGRAFHFRHKPSDNFKIIHQGETPLHYNAKNLLAKYFNNQIRNRTEVNYQYVSKEFGLWGGSKNIIENANCVNIEKKVANEYKPDISVSKDGKPILTIEIVRSHDIDDGALNYINTSGTPCLKIYITEALYKIYSDKINQQQYIEFWSDDENIELLNIELWEQEKENDIHHLINEIKNLKLQYEFKEKEYKSNKGKLLQIKEDNKNKIYEMDKEIDKIVKEIINIEKKQEKDIQELERIKQYYEHKRRVVVQISEKGLCLCKNSLGGYYEIKIPSDILLKNTTPEQEQELKDRLKKLQRW